MKVFYKSLIALGLSAMSAQSFAAAFQLAEQNVSGLGRAYAGEASAADDASVVGRNAALMTQFNQAQASVAAMYVMPDVSLAGTSTNNGMNPNVLDDSSIAPNAVIPAAYYTQPINDQWYVGVGVYSQFGLATEFDANYAAGQLAGETEIVTINTNFSVAYKVDEQWSLAFGLDHVYADAKIVRNFGASPLPVPAQTEAVRLEGDDQAFGWHVGVAYELDAQTRIGFSYRSETDITFEGDFSNQLPAGAPFYGTQGQKLPGSVELTLPAMAELSASHQYNEVIGVHASLNWTGWNSFQSLAAQVEGRGTVFSKNESFSNSWRVAVGSDYQYSKELKLRLGLAYDQSPADQAHLSISIPDTDRIWFSFGGEYQIDAQSSVDVGVSVLRGKTQNFVEHDNLGQAWGFESRGHATVIGAQYNYAF
ncbi:outer membrane protein transport protein [Pseudoalteromonas fenneropenaei]|uniref:Outer membrane protein transport protein n=1 Tax=Pseudoalteromonas fenneropenaei TaxID=1737459 RepID=A0ABV7CKZ5_9GAMM